MTFIDDVATFDPFTLVLTVLVLATIIGIVAFSVSMLVMASGPGSPLVDKYRGN